MQKEMPTFVSETTLGLQTDTLGRERERERERGKEKINVSDAVTYKASTWSEKRKKQLQSLQDE